jgi:hypothetical protein
VGMLETEQNIIHPSIAYTALVESVHYVKLQEDAENDYQTKNFHA